MLHSRSLSLRTAALLVSSALSAAPHSASHAASCSFSDLRWSADGARLLFVASCDGEARRLEVDPSTGALVCPEPVVREPSWCEAGRRVVFRDVFGIYELRPDEPHAAARQLLFLPAVARTFLRAGGEDAQGRALAWTYDRDAAEHALWILGSGGVERIPGAPSGTEALRLWQSRNTARPFASVGGRFVRSTCIRRPGGTELLCLEQSVDRRRAGAFRLTLGPPAQVQVLLGDCSPTSLAPAADSSFSVIGLYEGVSDAGRSAVLSAWTVGWHEGKRLYQTALPESASVRTRHETWASWQQRGVLLWADAAGQLARLDTSTGAATILVPLGPAMGTAPVFRVVALEAADRDVAERAIAKLREAGSDAGILVASPRFEVQAGAASTRAEATSRAAALHRQGWAGAVVREGSAADVAPGLPFARTAGSGGRIAFVRNVDGASGRFAEIWLAKPKGEPKRLVESFETWTPPGTPQ
jgi:hypothetical protein